jgi:hypothetical protein
VVQDGPGAGVDSDFGAATGAFDVKDSACHSSNLSAELLRRGGVR